MLASRLGLFSHFSQHFLMPLLTFHNLIRRVNTRNAKIERTNTTQEVPEVRRRHNPSVVREWRASLDLLLQGSLEELQQQVLLALVGGVVVQREDHRVHELGRLVLGHLEDELSQVGGVGLWERAEVVCAGRKHVSNKVNDRYTTCSTSRLVE